jgi:phosphoglycolate phosphatase
VRGVLGPESSGYVHQFECGASLFGKASKFKHAIKTSGIPLAQTLCVGDETRDIDAAKEIGVACAAVLWGYATAEVLKAHAPNYVCASMDQVLELAADLPPP